MERRQKLTAGAALAGAGKRAAFALFYGPLHYLLVREIVRALPGAVGSVPTLVDLGCGTGPAGVAWAHACPSRPRLVGVDRHPWALGEAAWTYGTLGLVAQTRQGDLATAALPGPPAWIVAAFAMNELADRTRDAVLERLIDRAARGDAVLVVEPLAGFVASWWGSWRNAFEGAGGRADQWRFRVDLPPIVAELDRAAGLDHRELTGRSLFIEAVRA